MSKFAISWENALAETLPPNRTLRSDSAKGALPPPTPTITVLARLTALISVSRAEDVPRLAG